MSVAASLADIRRVAVGPVRRLFVGQFLKELGAGMTLALLVVYLHDVRHIPVTTATALLAWQAVLALLCSPLVGTLVDRVGPRPILMVGALLNAVGVAGYAFVTTTREAFAAMTLVAIAGSAIWGPLTALTARLVPQQDRTIAFGFSFMLTNLGLGIGGLIGATIVDFDRVGSFQLLYLTTALAYVVLFLAVLSMGAVGGRLTHPAIAEVAEAQAGDGSWREVLRDRRLLRYGVAGLLLLTFGYGSIDAGLALYVTGSVGLSEHAIGVIFATNTAVIVVAQLFVLARLTGRARSKVLGVAGLIWAGSWLLFAAALGMPAPWLALAASLLGMAVFALGETLWSPVAPALVNDLAPEHLRGRYNSFQSLMWGVSGAIGPLISGALLSREQGLTWTLLLAAGCALGAVIALRLGRSLSPAEEGLA